LPPTVERSFFPTSSSQTNSVHQIIHLSLQVFVSAQPSLITLYEAFTRYIEYYTKAYIPKRHHTFLPCSKRFSGARDALTILLDLCLPIQRIEKLDTAEAADRVTSSDITSLFEPAGLRPGRNGRLCRSIPGYKGCKALCTQLFWITFYLSARVLEVPEAYDAVMMLEDAQLRGDSFGDHGRGSCLQKCSPHRRRRPSGRCGLQAGPQAAASGSLPCCRPWNCPGGGIMPGPMSSNTIPTGGRAGGNWGTRFARG